MIQHRTSNIQLNFLALFCKLWKSFKLTFWFIGFSFSLIVDQQRLFWAAFARLSLFITDRQALADKYVLPQLPMWEKWNDRTIELKFAISLLTQFEPVNFLLKTILSFNAQWMKWVLRSFSSSKWGLIIKRNSRLQRENFLHKNLKCSMPVKTLNSSS